MKTLLAAITIALLVGCASIPEQLTDKNVFAVCSVGDSLTTYAILSAGGRELNPLLKGISVKLGAGKFLLLGLGAGLLVYLIWDHLHPAVQATATVVECGAFLHNIPVAF